jgi:hypothetical protein
VEISLKQLLDMSKTVSISSPNSFTSTYTFLFQRYPDDIYDRAWTSYNSIDWKKIDTSLTIDQRAPPLSFLMAPPSTVMRTTAIPANASESIKFHFLPKYNASRYYVYLYFNEIQKFQANQIREFNIFLNGELLNSDPLNPVYLENVYYISVVSETKLELWFNKTSRSTLPPLFNAVEIYMAKDFLQSETYQTDGMYYLVRYIDFTLKYLFTINSRPCTSLFIALFLQFD